MRTLQKPAHPNCRVAIYGDLAKHQNQSMTPLMATWQSVFISLIIWLIQHRIRHGAEQRIQTFHIP